MRNNEIKEQCITKLELTGTFILKVNDGNTRIMREIYSKLTNKDTRANSWLFWCFYRKNFNRIYTLF